MQLPVTPFIDFLNAVITAICSYYLYKSWLRNRQIMVIYYLAQGYFFLIFAYLFFSLPRLLLPNSLMVMGIGIIFAQAFLFLGVAFLAKVTMYFFKVAWVKRIFYFILLLSAVAIFFMVVSYKNPSFNQASGIMDWNFSTFVEIASIVIFAGVLLPSAGYFSWHGFKSEDKIIRTRSLLMAVGFLALTITAGTYYTASTLRVALVSDLLSLISFVVIFIGMIYKRDK